MCNTEPTEMATLPLVQPFTALGAASLPVAGGKAASLGAMSQADLPVPPGFCVMTAAYERLAHDLDLAPLSATLEALDPMDEAAAASQAATVRARILDWTMPASLAAAIEAAYRALGDAVPVAVRSSATAEDLPTASFAGQQDTFLHVIGTDAVLDAVRRCWASLWTERAVHYRQNQGIGHRGVTLAVAVQRMVDSEVAGVLFTADPMTGRRHQAVIDASFGLGESVVSGLVNPDHFLVDPHTGTVIERRLGDKRLAVRQLSGGGTQRIELPDGSAQACLSDDRLRDLAALGERVEAHFGRPQDIEFAFDPHGSLWLLQARPITTLYPLPAVAPDHEDDLRVYLSVNVAQGVLQPLTPMGMQAFRLIAGLVTSLVTGRQRGGADAPGLFVEAGYRLFADVTPALRDRVGRAILARVMPQMEARSGRIFRHLLETEPRLAPTATPAWRSALVVLRAVWRSGMPLRVLDTAFRPNARRQRAIDATTRLAAAADGPPGMTAAGRLDAFEALMASGIATVFTEIIPVAVAGFAANVLLGTLLGDDATAAELQIVRRALPFNPTTAMDLALWDLAQTARRDETAKTLLETLPAAALADRYRSRTLPDALQTAMAGFLSRFGQRGLPEIDLGEPRWSENPTYLFGILHNLLLVTDPSQAPDVQLQRAEREALAMAAELRARAARRGWLHSRLVRFALDRMRALLGMREAHKFHLVTLFAAGRRLLLPVGTELARAGRLAHAVDIFFLTLAEARSGLAGADFRGVVSERREGYDHERRRRHVPRVLLSDGSMPTADDALPTAGALPGTPASPGRITAKARVIRDPVGAHLQPGEILVAPSTDPGWTPLFLSAGGLVMEMGGAMSHGAVVAREYGIPAVVGVPGATDRITTGHVITIDGTTGFVHLEQASRE
jgi:pyruvate,water dikinase